jgi:cation transport regulator ChaC
MPDTIILKDGEQAVFGYGSLLSKRSMEKTLGRSYQEPPAICSITGWRRTWDVFMPNNGKFIDEQGAAPKNIIYLNIRETLGASVNGVLYVVPAATVSEFDAREWVYNRMDATKLLSGVEVRGGPAWVYVGKPEFLVETPQRTDYAVRQTYINVVEEGLADLGREFRAEYEASTDAVPRHLLIHDRPTLHPAGTT